MSKLDRFVQKAREKHGQKYDYSLVEYVSSVSKVVIVCPDHGKFEQIPANHVRGLGCSSCGNSKKGQFRKHTRETFLELARSAHGERYDYSLSVYAGYHEKIKIICKKHGVFEQSVAHHVLGSNCPECVGKKRYSTDEFIVKAKNVHGEKYSYEFSSYVNNHSKMEIACDKHGIFLQNSNDHLDGHGCPKCKSDSSGERELYEFLVPYGAQRGDRKILDGKEIDIYVPARNLAIEYCGLYWHRESKGKHRFYHWEKYQRCLQQNIRLLTIYDDEWITQKSKIERILLHSLGVEKNITGARNLQIREIEKRDAREFCDLYHLQGRSPIRVSLGAFHEERLVGVMVFSSPSRQSCHDVELRRFCTNGAYAGLADRMFKFYVRNWSPQTVVSFSDHRYYSGAVYHKMGFVHDGVLFPDYEYVRENGSERTNKSRFRVNRLHAFGHKGTEREIMSRLGYDRVWDCGKTRWVYRN